MAGGGMVSTEKRGKKALDAAINLVPFIDLLSCCLSFLLITAVWSQLAAVPASHGPGDSTGERDPNDVQLTLFVHAEGFRLEKSNAEPVSIEDRADRHDFVQLATLMEQFKQANPNKHDIVLHADDRVAYQRVIMTMDVLRAANFPAIHVSER